MNLQEVRDRLDEERRTLPQGADALETRPLLTRAASAAWGQHWIIASSLDPHNADAAIAEEIEHYRSIGAAVEWKLYRHDTPADLMERLQRHGFEIGPQEAVLVLDLRDPPAWIDTAHEVIRIEKLEQIPLFRAAAEQIFGKDYAMTAGQLADALRSGNSSHLGYVALCDDEPASIGRLYTHPASHFGGLYGGGTVERFRGRGLYRALVAARARDASELGARYLIVDALPTSHPILQRLGFVHLTDTWPCEGSPASEASS